MIKEYLIQEKLGIGSYGTVYKVINKNTNNIYVIKQISLFGLSKEEIKDVKLEAKILSSIKSVYVVRYLESFEEKNFLNIVMEYCDGGDLGQFIEDKKAKNENINEDLIWKLFIKITLGLAAIHKLKILHRDLKTLNIFLTKDLDIKIGDLGVAKMLSHSGCFAKTLIGTPYYLSPELCEEKPYNDKSDVWALGCILYELCTFKHPFNAKSQGGLILKILKEEPEPIGNNYSKDMQTLINNILEKTIEKRPSCKDLLKKDIIIEKAKEFGLYNMIVELYPELNDNSNNNDNSQINSKMNNFKIIYNKNRYLKNYKINNSLHKNNSINKIEISSNVINKNKRNIYKKTKSQFNSISTDSRSHNSIKNIFFKNKEKEPKDNQRNKIKNTNGANIIISNSNKIENNISNNNISNNNKSNNNISNNNINNNITNNNINNNNNNISNNNNNVNKPFVKKPLNKFPLSSLNKNLNNNINNGRYINIEQYNNCLKINSNNIKEIKSINTSSKSAKKKNFINFNNNSKVNLIKNGIGLRANKSTGKNFIIQRPNTPYIPERINLNNNNDNNKNNNNNNNYQNNIRYVNTNNNININQINIKHINTNITTNNIKDENEETGNNIKLSNQKQIDVTKSIENFENKLKNYYQYSPEIKAKRLIYNNNLNKNNLKTPSKGNNISENILFKLTPIDIIDSNNINLAEGNYNKNSNGKNSNNNLMEFIKNLNEYVPQYKINNNQIPNGYKRNKNKSKSVCQNDNLINYNNIQKQINTKIVPQ